MLESINEVTRVVFMAFWINFNLEFLGGKGRGLYRMRSYKNRSKGQECRKVVLRGFQKMIHQK